MKVTNKSAYFDYELGDRIEAGMVLSGAEVKSVKAGSVDMSSAHVKIRSKDSKSLKEAFVIGLHIYPYVHADSRNYVADKTRKLLLNRKEIISLEAKMKSAGRTLVPTAIYDKHGRIKMELALARGKKKYEKRDVIKRRDMDREEERNR